MSAGMIIDMSDAQAFLDAAGDGISEKTIEQAMEAESQVLIDRLSTSSDTPRLRIERKWKNRSRKHMADDMHHSPLGVTRAGVYQMDIGPQLKTLDRHAYAGLVNDGTTRIRAREFMEKAADAVGNRALEAAMDVLRKGLGVYG